MYCEINDSEIHYIVRGEGRPLLMLHGLLLDHRSILPLDAEFAQRPGWQRIYLDLPGMGKSAAGHVHNSDQMLDVVSGFVDQVLGERFSVFGYSYGGYLAQGLAVRRGADIDGLGLLAPVVVPEEDARILPETMAITRDEALLAQLPETQRLEFEKFFCGANAGSAGPGHAGTSGWG
ncbi:MAG: alpha/beta hydrolase [Rhodobacteraceae bacterium]|nr:alpha/beta hydrolase [Paracoccaceae bacterium]